ncbi:MAG: type II toxin-antitoxin system RelB/DinJ family antitoxin [Oscillospiraceae bacterium]|jgi:DNA-damage-inducible protein J|nr:type II toxin-antitoxin system RelB/DinJ family antitoxin [Oscillospiraceae bacterium]
MPKTASIYIRIDPQIKAEIQAIYAKYGISVTEAINIFLHQSRNVGGLPFDLRETRYNAETEAAIQEAREIMSGKRKAKMYTTVDELFSDLGDD